MTNQNTKTTTTTTTTTAKQPETITQINNNTNKTLQPTQHDVQTSIGIGSGGIAMGIISLLSVVFGVIYKILSNKKFRANLKNLIDEIDKDYQKIKEEYNDKKHDIAVNPALLNDKKQAMLDELTTSYNVKLQQLQHRKEILIDKMKGGK